MHHLSIVGTNCNQEYRTTCLLGCETDTYDSEGSVVRRAPWKHITPEDVKSKLAEFTGNIQQTPPMLVLVLTIASGLMSFTNQQILGLENGRHATV